MNDVDPVALSIFLFFFVLVTAMGFLAARWRKVGDLDNLDEWGLGGRSFGTFVAWFLIGGDIYTAYTFIAVPATLYAGSVTGFFAVPYTIILYPIIFIFLPRLWSVSHRRRYVTPADFVQGRFDSKSLSLAIAFTGILATLPYIALQLVGIQAVLDVMGLGGGEDAGWFEKDLPLFVAFAVLAAYTYSSGLRAPALIAFVKDALIYVVIIVAVVYLPTQLGGWGGIFESAEKAFSSFNSDNADAIAAGDAGAKGLIPGMGVSQWAYASLSLGSALALFMYPHSVTAVLSTKNRNIIRRNAALLPAYSFLLGLLALLGIAAIAAGIQVKNPQLAIPQLFEQEFSPWFAGVAFAAIAIGAFVPAAIMSIAAANLWTRNIYKAFINPAATDAQEAKQSKLASLLVKFGALIFVLALPKDFAINLQLLGGIWILQTLPSIVVGLYTRWLHRYALLAGWAVGMVWGT
ncbi:MAG: sodium:solute symporter, partial [Hyphomicrobiales bacterium]